MSDAVQEKDVVAAQGGALDGFKWVVALVFIAAAVVGNGFYDEQPVLYRALGVVALVGLGLWVSGTTYKGKEFLGLLRESRIELRKVVWPTRQETIQTTLGVVAMVLVVALILWLLDMLLGWGVSSIIGS
jgi:preprotein translocase subunit SecE